MDRIDQIAKPPRQDDEDWYERRYREIQAAKLHQSAAALNKNTVDEIVGRKERKVAEEVIEVGGRKYLLMSGDGEIDQMLVDCMKTMRTKGEEYTIGSTDRLANFRSVSEEVESPIMKVWYTYFYKHVSALISYVKTGAVKSNEPIGGRIMDCIVYLFLFHKMTLENERNRDKDIPF